MYRDSTNSIINVVMVYMYVFVRSCYDRWNMNQISLELTEADTARSRTKIHLDERVN